MPEIEKCYFCQLSHLNAVTAFHFSITRIIPYSGTIYKMQYHQYHIISLLVENAVTTNYKSYQPIRK